MADDSGLPTKEEQLAALATFVKTTVAVDRVFLESCLDRARALVSHRVGTSEVPAPVLAGAIHDVAADIFHRRRVRNGVTGFDTPEFTPVRVTRDPMKAAEADLAPFLGPGIA